MNQTGPTFNFVQDPLLQTPNVNYGQEIQKRINYLVQMKEQYGNNIPTKQQSLWEIIDIEVNKLTSEQQSILFNHNEYKQNGKVLEGLVQTALFNSVKAVIEQSDEGSKILKRQLEIIRSNKDAIVAESNRKYELFEKFKVASAANPNLTYTEFCKTLNG